MATTATVTARLASSDTRAHIITVTGPASYVAGGDALTAAQLGFGNEITTIQSAVTSTGLLAVWDDTNNKLQFFYPTGGAATSPAAIADPATTITPVNPSITIGGTAAVKSGGATASAVDATTPTVDLSSVTATPNGGSATGTLTPGRGKEVNAATDLSGTVVLMLALGI